MKTLATLALVVLYIVLGTPNLSLSAGSNAVTGTNGLGLMSYPVTNESVEDGLRKNREALRALPRFQSNDALTHLQLATILSQQGDPNGAIEEYQVALSLDPSSVEAYRGLGAVFIDKHEWTQAQQALQKGTILNPQDHQAFYWLGRSLIAQGHFPQAQKALTTATQLDPTNPEAYSDLGLALMAQGLIQEAEKALAQAITLQPDFAEAHHRLEHVQSTHGNPPDLIQRTQQILDTIFRRE